MLPPPGATMSPSILKHLISLSNEETERAKLMKIGIIYSVGLDQRGVVIRGGSERELKGGRLRPVGGDTSPSYNPPRDCNISSI